MRRPAPARLAAAALTVALLITPLAAPPVAAQIGVAPTLPPPTETPWPDATPIAVPPPTHSPAPPPRPVDDPGGWLADPLDAIAGQVANWVRAAVVALLTAAVRPFVEEVAGHWERLAARLDFLTTTPAALTYDWPTVVAAHERLRAVANAALGLLALLAAYNVFRPHLGLASEPPLTTVTRLALAALAANTSHWWTALVIDLNNALIRRYAPAALTGLFQSDHLLGWLTMHALATPLFLLFAIVTIVAVCALVIQLWGRLILLNVLLVLCPLAVVLAATPQTAAWAARWRDQFLAAVFSQALALLALALATQLVAPIFLAGQPGMSALAALGGLWLASQTPRWLRDHAVPSVVGLAGTASPLAAVTTVELTVRRVRALARPGRRTILATPVAADATGSDRALPTDAPRAASLGRPSERRAEPDAPRVIDDQPPPAVGAPVAWDDRQRRWVMPAALPRSGAPVQPLPRLGLAVVLPTDRPYLLNEEDGLAWVPDADALPTDRRRVRLGRDRAGALVALIAPDPAHAAWDGARGRLMAPVGTPADAPTLAYDGDAVAPRFVARPTPAAVRAAGGQPATLAWEATRRAWTAAPADAGPVARDPATGAIVRAHPDPLATLHPAGGAWVLPPRTVPGRATYAPVEAIAPVTVPATAYPAAPAEPTAVPLTRRALATIPLVPVPDQALNQARGPAALSDAADHLDPPPPRPIAFPELRRRP